MSSEIPDEFKPYRGFLIAANNLMKENMNVSIVMRNCFLQGCEEVETLSPEAEAYLNNLRQTVPDPPERGVEETRAFADNLYMELTNQFEQGQIRKNMPTRFFLCATIYSVLAGEDAEQRERACKIASTKIKKILEKSGESNGNAAPPPFNPAGPSIGGPPVFTPPGGAGGPPVFTPPGQGGPPVFTPPGQSGPPVFTPPGQGGPPVFTPPGGAGGPPVFTPPGAGGPPAYTPPNRTSSQQPPQFTPGGYPNLDDFSSSASNAPPVAPTRTSSAPQSSSFDMNRANQLFASLGVQMSKKSPKLNDACKKTILRYLEYAISRLSGPDPKQALPFLKDALLTWDTGKLQ